MGAAGCAGARGWRHLPAAEAEARERAQNSAAVQAAAQADAQALQLRDEQTQRVLELRREREVLALVATSQDTAQREQVERAELEVRELYERLEQLRASSGGAVEELRVQRDRGTVAAELKRAIELYERAAGRDLEAVYYGVQEVRERLEAVQGLVLADRRLVARLRNAESDLASRSWRRSAGSAATVPSMR